MYMHLLGTIMQIQANVDSVCLSSFTDVPGTAAKDVAAGFVDHLRRHAIQVVHNRHIPSGKPT